MSRNSLPPHILLDGISDKRAPFPTEAKIARVHKVPQDMTEEEMIIETVRSTMEHGIESPRRTDMIWKIKVFMRCFGVGDRSPAHLLSALEVAGLKLVHTDAGTGSKT